MLLASMHGPIATTLSQTGHVWAVLALPNTHPGLRGDLPLKVSGPDHSNVLGSMMIPSQSFLGNLNKMSENSVPPLSSRLRSCTLGHPGPLGVGYGLANHSPVPALLQQ